MIATAADYLRFQQEGGIADLSARAKLRLTGADRIRYLNGQVTANVTRLPTGAAQPACVTTAKGKLCADVFLSAAPDSPAVLIDAEPSLREPLLARLERYIISDDAVLEDVTAEFALLHLLRLDPATHPLAAQALPLRARRFGQEGWDLWLPTEHWSALRSQYEGCILPDSLLESLRLEAGLPRWGFELGEDTLPPEAGLDLTHIDYHKGCYVGQEVISRVKSVGHVNRHLRGFLTAGGQPLAPGWRLFAPEAPAKPLGHITSAAWSFALAKPIALGYLKRGSPAQLRAGPADGGGPELEVTACDLPFTAS
jgi:folate-binding protein YgfZ